MSIPALGFRRLDRMRGWAMASTRVALAVAVLGMACPALAQGTQTMPTVRVVATGGTIAGEQQDPGTLGGYEIKKSVNEILMPTKARILMMLAPTKTQTPSGIQKIFDTY